ncbi:MAG TPA: hotdog fold thioesterase [Steroidobacteraceae bacterium]|nr:hotdog fold thioesterase [Steroidobacteraceae bacterium]
MSIWFRHVTLDDLVSHCRSTLAEHLGIRVTEIGPDYLRGALPVDRRTHQTMGILHGGASAALAETLGSIAGNMCVDTERFVCVGQEINANHVRPAASGEVTGTARPIHIGHRTQVWQIEIRDPRERLVCISRLTLAVLARAEVRTPGATS